MLKSLVTVAGFLTLTICCSCQQAIPSKDTGAISALNADAFSDYFMNTKLSDRVAGYTKTVPLDVVSQDPSSLHRKDWGGPFPEISLLSLSANTDLVIEGIPQTKTSGLCAAGTFVCSDYEVLVTRVIKNNRQAVIAGQTIVIARAGGIMKIAGTVVRGIEPNFPPYKLGETYVLFLTLIPQSGSFKAYPGSSFHEVGDKIVDCRINFGIHPADRDIFMSELARAVIAPHVEVK